MNKILLGAAIIVGTTASLFPESGVSIERATFVLVYTIALIKMLELTDN